jgi:hypothetical protein
MRPENVAAGIVAAPYFAAARPRPSSSHSRRAAEWPTTLHQYQGRRVSIALVDGPVLSECVLVSAGTGRVQTLWIFTGDADVFIPKADVADIRLEAEDQRNEAA